MLQIILAKRHLLTTRDITYVYITCYIDAMAGKNYAFRETKNEKAIP